MIECPATSIFGLLSRIRKRIYGDILSRETRMENEIKQQFSLRAAQQRIQDVVSLVVALLK